MAKDRLIVSFIGNVDLAHYGIRARGGDRAADIRETSPILRLLLHLKTKGLCNAGDAEVLLFDDKPQEDAREEFCARLKSDFIGLGLGDDLTLIRYPLELANGPTDYDALYKGVWSAIPSGDRRPREIIFHLSSGTPAMHATLLLAANCLTIGTYRLFQTSREQGAVEVKPPFVLALRERSRAYTKQNILPEKALGTLLPNTVIDDEQARGAYAVLFRAATRRRSSGAAAPAVRIEGVEGSGKWHAAQQFGKWRQDCVIEWLKPFERELDDSTRTILLRRMDIWPENELRRLSGWRASHPGIALAGTWRTGTKSVGTVCHDSLRDWERVFLPGLDTRTDIIALAEMLARSTGLASGKLKQRLQFDLFRDRFPRGLYDLRAKLAAAGSRSSGLHADIRGYEEANQIEVADEARLFLRAAFDVLAELRFGPGHSSLEEVLGQIEVATISLAKPGRSHDTVAQLLGCSQANVSNKLKKKSNLPKWREQLQPDSRPSDDVRGNRN